jgi:hypothetical protein
MASYARVLTRWVGGPSSPGLTVMNVRYDSGAGAGVATAVRAFWDSLKTYIPSAYTLSVDATMDTHDVATGTLNGSISAGAAPASVVGTAVGSYAAGVGARVNWNTSAIVRGRRVNGRTFIVPMAVVAYQSDGTILDSTVTAVTTAAQTLRGALVTAGFPMAIWTAPTQAGPGALNDVFDAACADQVAVLRGRRVS